MFTISPLGANLFRDLRLVNSCRAGGAVCGDTRGCAAISAPMQRNRSVKGDLTRRGRIGNGGTVGQITFDSKWLVGSTCGVRPDLCLSSQGFASSGDGSFVGRQRRRTSGAGKPCFNATVRVRIEGRPTMHGTS